MLFSFVRNRFFEGLRHSDISGIIASWNMIKVFIVAKNISHRRRSSFRRDQLNTHIYTCIKVPVNRCKVPLAPKRGAPELRASSLEEREGLSAFMAVHCDAGLGGATENPGAVMMVA